MVPAPTLRRRSGRHGSAALGAGPAGLSTLPAVVMVSGVLFALGCTTLAGLRTDPAGLWVQVTAAHQQPGGEGAGIRAVPVKTDAFDHHVDVVLSQARGRTVFAGRKAAQAGVNAGLQFGADVHARRHLNLPGETFSIKACRLNSCTPAAKVKTL